MTDPRLTDPLLPIIARHLHHTGVLRTTADGPAEALRVARQVLARHDPTPGREQNEIAEYLFADAVLCDRSLALALRVTQGLARVITLHGGNDPHQQRRPVPPEDGWQARQCSDIGDASHLDRPEFTRLWQATIGQARPGDLLLYLVRRFGFPLAASHPARAVCTYVLRSPLDPVRLEILLQGERAHLAVYGPEALDKDAVYAAVARTLGDLERPTVVGPTLLNPLHPHHPDGRRTAPVFGGAGRPVDPLYWFQTDDESLKRVSQTAGP